MGLQTHQQDPPSMPEQQPGLLCMAATAYSIHSEPSKKKKKTPKTYIPK